MSVPWISISVVSHGQGDLVDALLRDLARLPEPGRFELLLTRNLPEPLPAGASNLPFPLVLIDNVSPKGFGSNHNAALARARGAAFCVANPDLRIPGDPFPPLLRALRCDDVGLVGPRVRASDGAEEDSIRRFPTVPGLLKRALGLDDGRIPLPQGDDPVSVDWVAGMFMLARAEAFRAVGGFDESYFLYYEDVDLCVRLWRQGWRVAACPAAEVIHDARRDSHRNLRYLSWHLASLLRFQRKHAFRLPHVSSS